MHPSTVIILGAGVTGLSTAYNLALKGNCRVIVLDKGSVGDGSSSRAAAIITGLLWTETGVLLRKLALRRFRELSSELDDYQFHNVGCLNLFGRASWSERESLLSLYRDHRAPHEVLSSDEIQRRWPALNVDSDVVGLFDPLGGYSEPEQYLAALARKCRELGVEIREHCQFTGLRLSNGRATGVETADGIIEGDAVVCTLYAWALKALEPMRLSFPMKAFVHQRYETAPLAQSIKIPAVNANHCGGYFRPSAGGRLLVGIETTEREEYRVSSADFQMNEIQVPADLAEQAWANMSGLLPVLVDAPWQTEKVGLITFSMDGEPILGPIEQIPGLYLGTAFHSGGFAYNPATGQMLAELVSEGKASIDISAFSPGRFDEAAVASYLQETVQQKHASRRRH